MNKRRKILAAMLAAFLLMVPMFSTAQIDIKGDDDPNANFTGTFGTMQITDYQTEEYVPLGEGLWLLAGAAGLYLLVKSRKTRKATAVAAAALALTLGTAQCKKTEESVIPAGETISISFMAGNGAKSDIDVTTGRITWEDNDEVYVVYGGKLLSNQPLLATPDPENRVNATISGTITTAVTIGENPEFTFYYVGSGVDFTPKEASTSLTFDISSQDGINAGHYMVGRTGAVEMEKKGGKYGPATSGGQHFDPLTSVLRLNTSEFGANQSLTMSGGNSQMTISLTGDATPSYTAGSGITFSSGEDVRISVIPTTTAGDAMLNFSGNGKVGSITVTNGIKAGRIYSKVTNNAGYPIPVEAIGSDVLPGVFTIDAEGRQVRFSKGNLQYRAVGGAAGNASASAEYKNSVGGTWRFAVNQYDICGNNNTNLSATYDGWIDLFGWGTSGWNHNNNQYCPWATNTTNDNYDAYNDSGKGLDDGVNIPDFGCNMADWGYNTIYSGETPTTGWRTLSSNEWLTLIGRTKGGNKLYGLATVNGQQGLIILPDDWNCPAKLSFAYGAYAYGTNVYSVEEWTKMQNAGAVFLPKAGVRKQTTYPYTDGTSIYDYVGQYWTTTYDKNYFYFQSKKTNTVSVNDIRNYYGLSVRLVKDVPNGFNGGNANDFEPGTW